MYLALALLSSLVLGAADFVGGAAARRGRAVSVVVWSNAAGLLIAATIVLLVVPGAFDGADLAWGAAAGLSGSVGAVLLYRALACGVMSLVAPTSAAAAAAVPVTAGIASGEQLDGPAIVGVTAALVSVVLLTRTSTSSRQGTDRVVRGMAYAVLAGISFGVFLVLLAQTSGASGLWPLVGARLASLTMLGLWAFATRAALPSRVDLRLIVGSGVMDMAANVLFLLATRAGALTVTSLLVSMSPVVIVLLARQVLAERLHRSQVAAVALSLLAVAAVTIG